MTDVHKKEGLLAHKGKRKTSEVRTLTLSEVQARFEGAGPKMEAATVMLCMHLLSNLLDNYQYYFGKGGFTP
jgi:hypothetical protein